MATKRVPFIVANLGADADPFMIHILAALAQKERAMIADRKRVAEAKNFHPLGARPNVGPD